MVEETSADEEDDEDSKRKKRKKKRGGKGKKKRRLNKLLSTLFCCFRPHLCPHSDNKRGSKVADQDGNNENDDVSTFIGPMTLREYVATLEPYNPWLHGWRGQEPRLEWHGPPSVILPTPRAYRRHAH